MPQIKNSVMKEQLALFPLQLVVFPNEKLNLHLFEPKYRQLLADVEAEGMSFGIPTFLDNKIMPIGTEVVLKEIVERYPTGESDIRTQAGRVFRILDFKPRLGRKLYAGGVIEWLDPDIKEDPSRNEEILGLLRRLYTTLNIERELPINGYDFLTYDIAHHIGLSTAAEYQLLCTMDALTRQMLVLEHLRRTLPEAKEKEDLRRKALLNGHFKNIIPPKI
jgi:Lon protease-like protein